MADTYSDNSPAPQADLGAQGVQAEPQSQLIPPEPAEQSDDEILKTALARFQLAVEAESDMRKDAESDLEHLSGKQWDLEKQQERMLEGRPCLVVNRLPQAVQQVTNDARQNRPAIKVSPLDTAASKDVADLIEGIVRHIEYASEAEIAYDTASEYAARCGFGYWRLRTDYVSPDSFDQDILIEAIQDPASVYLDPFRKKQDGSDTNWGFIIADLSVDEFKARYPNSKLGSTSDWSGMGSSAPRDWITEKGARVAEYFYKEMRPGKIHLLASGETVRDEDLASRQIATHQAGRDHRIVKTRDTRYPVVKWCTITAVEILERTLWVGSYVPIIPVYGNEIVVKGKRIVESVIRHAKGPQQLLNYMKSAAAESIGLAPKAPFLVAEGQIEGHERIWEEANRKNHAFLPYKPTSIASVMVPPPQRQVTEPAVQAITQAQAGAIDDIQATTGHYPSVAGAPGNEISGVAIDARSGQSQMGNFHITDNVKRAIRHTGRCLVEIIPKVYDSARAARIVKEDGSQKVVRVNEKHTDPETGKEVLYSLSAGTYDVVVDSGPSFATKRKEAAASMLEFAKAIPNTAPLIADQIAANMDWHGAQEIAQRLKLTLPPQVQQAEGSKQPVPPQAMAMIQQQHAFIQKLQAQANDYAKIIETKQLELQHKERVELWNIQLQEKKLAIDAEVNLAKLQTQGSIALLEQEIGALKHDSALLNKRLQLLGANQPIEAPNDFDALTADGGNVPLEGHVGGGMPTGGQSPGQSMEPGAP